MSEVFGQQKAWSGMGRLQKGELWNRKTLLFRGKATTGKERRVLRGWIKRLIGACPIFGPDTCNALLSIGARGGSRGRA